jgi:hypothetical protein
MYRRIAVNGMAKAAIGAVALAVIVVVAVLFRPGGDGVGDRSASGTHAPAAIQAPEPEAGGPIHGWPGTREEPAGRYSWDMARQAWMHHAHGGTVGVSLTFSFAHTMPDEGTPVTIAGFPGRHEEAPHTPGGSRFERWVVHMDDTVVEILLEGVHGTTEAQLAEAYAVIDSLERVPRNGSDEYRLVFTLPEGWDSG